MKTLLVIDTETGGLNPDQDSLLSVAAVVWQDGELVAETHLFVNESDLHIRPESVAIHGLNEDWVRLNGLPPKEVVANLDCFLRRHFPEVASGGFLQLAGHNVAFDIAFLKRLYRLAGIDYPQFYSHRLVDTATLALFFIMAGRLPTQTAKSDELFAHFNVLPTKRGLHSALDDARATAKLINAFLRGVKGVDALEIKRFDRPRPDTGSKHATAPANLSIAPTPATC